MTSPIGKPTSANPRRPPPAFTLIELILVMALLVIVVGLVTPFLSGFFRGRSLDAEARRFLTLTRYGQNRAVTEGVPMILWIDAQEQAYGLEAQPGYLDQDSKAVRYQLESDLEITVGQPLSSLGRSAPQRLSRLLPANLQVIRLTPDGFVHPDNPETIVIRSKERDGIVLGPNGNRLSYEIKTNHLAALPL